MKDLPVQVFRFDPATDEQPYLQHYLIRVHEGARVLHVLHAIHDEHDPSFSYRYCCGSGQCGSCAVLVNGEPVNSCILPAMKVSGQSVTTIEGLAKEDKLDPLQEAFVDEGAVQCGFCTPAMVLSAKALLEKNPHPDESQIRQSLSGVLCRCTGYSKIVKAVQKASLNRRS